VKPTRLYKHCFLSDLTAASQLRSIMMPFIYVKPKIPNLLSPSIPIPPLGIDA
jgi:hypothetical protein